MRFLVDMPVTPRAAAHLRAEGHDAVHALAIGFAAKSDSEIIELASAQDLIVITADLDYPRLLALLKTDRPGVILFRGGSYSDEEMIALLDRVLAQGDTLDLPRSITVVDRHRVRHRRLPLSD